MSRYNDFLMKCDGGLVTDMDWLGYGGPAHNQIQRSTLQQVCVRKNLLVIYVDIGSHIIRHLEV